MTSVLFCLFTSTLGIKKGFKGHQAWEVDGVTKREMMGIFLRYTLQHLKYSSNSLFICLQLKESKIYPLPKMVK